MSDDTPCSGNPESCTASPASDWRTFERECSWDEDIRNEAETCGLSSRSCSRKTCHRYYSGFHADLV